MRSLVGSQRFDQISRKIGVSEETVSLYWRDKKPIPLWCLLALRQTYGSNEAPTGKGEGLQREQAAAAMQAVSDFACEVSRALSGESAVVDELVDLSEAVQRGVAKIRQTGA